MVYVSDRHTVLVVPLVFIAVINRHLVSVAYEPNGVQIESMEFAVWSIRVVQESKMPTAPVATPPVVKLDPADMPPIRSVYIDGPADFSGGGIINATQDPHNLTIYSTGPTLTIDGDNGFYGAVIAPNTTVTFTGSSEIYGTVMAGFLQLFGDTQIHVDTELVSDILGVGPGSPVLVQ